MSHQIITPTPQQWDDFVRRHPRGHLLQLSVWGSLKGDFGWQPHRVAVADDAGRLLAGAQLLFRSLPFRLGRLAYIPFGPLVDWIDEDLTRQVMAGIDETAQRGGAAFVKMEPGYDIEPQTLTSHGFKHSPQTVQPPNTILINLSEDDDAILARMNQMTRRNIRKSAKNEISIREGTRADVDSFNAMLDETGRRQDFGVHVASYYERAYELFVPNGDAALLIASYGELDLAGVFVFKLGQNAWYLYGASRRAEPKRMAAFGAQWAGLQWAKANGCTTYDMVGIPDEDEVTLEAQFQDRDDGLWGVYRFKRGWGGDITRTIGAWDRVYNPLIYRLYTLGLKLRS